MIEVAASAFEMVLRSERSAWANVFLASSSGRSTLSHTTDPFTHACTIVGLLPLRTKWPTDLRISQRAAGTPRRIVLPTLMAAEEDLDRWYGPLPPQHCTLTKSLRKEC